jgi:hypothetical protein
MAPVTIAPTVGGTHRKTPAAQQGATNDTPTSHNPTGRGPQLWAVPTLEEPTLSMKKAR